MLEASINGCHFFDKNKVTLICKATDSESLLFAMHDILHQNNVSFLFHIIINGCNLTEISNKTFDFDKLESVAKLDLSRNGLSWITSGLFYPKALRQLERLILAHNNIWYLPSDQLILRQLQFLDISFNKITQIESDAFSYLRNVRAIELKHNKITSLPKNLFRYKIFYRLEFLDFSYNNITFIPNKFLKSKYLEGLLWIYLQNNNIKTVKPDMLPDKLNKLSELTLSHNQIESIGEILPLLLRGRYKLPFYLNVAYNKLTVQETDYIQDYVIRFYSFYLNNQYNNISKFERIPFEKSTFTSFNVGTLPNERFVVNSTGNQIFSLVNLVEASTGININELDKVDWSSLKKFQMSRILKIHNLVRYFRYKYHCDCDVLKYWSFLETEYFKEGLMNYKEHVRKFYSEYGDLFGDVDKAFNNVTCGSPRHLAGKYLHNLKKSDLQCDISGCTDNKCSCTLSPFNNTARINCNGMMLTTMPIILEETSDLEIYFDHNMIQSILIPDMFISERVLVLDLSYNKIKNIPKEFFLHYINLNILNLAGNMLSTIPSIEHWNSVSNLSLTDLRNNHFVCDCPGLELKKTLVALSSRLIVFRLHRIGCYFPLKLKDRIIYNLPDSLFGCPFVNLTLLMSLLLTFLLLLVILASLAFAFRYYIRLFLFVHCGWRFGFSYPKDGTLYDVFISYCEKDSDWVMEHLVNPLENLELPYKLCLHERDFLVGVPICDNITNAVEGSKCTLVVVSENWLESDWCQYEFRVHMRS